jgi:tetratricopeptide (TPR) repeat protein
VQHDPRVYISLGLVVLALLITAVVGYVRQPIVGFWGLAFFLVLGPTSSFLPIDDLAFEHRLYVPLAGALVLGGLLVSRMAVMLIPQPHARERVLLALFMVTCLGWGSCTVYRNALYANDVALWKSVVAVNPQHPRAWNNLAGAHRLKREHAAARDCLETALRLKPTDMFALWRLPLVLLDLAEKKQDPQLRATVRSLGERLMEAHPTNARHRVTFIKLLTALGETDEAEQACVALAATLSDPTLAKEFQRKRPRWDSPTLDLDPLADTWFQWALILHARGDTQGAWEKLALARQRAAADPAVPFQQGVVLAAAGRHSEAEACYRQAIDLDTSHEVAWNNLGVLLVQLQRAQEAAECYRTALYWHPEYVEALDNLGNWYARSRRYREALALYERALASDANYEPARKHHDLALARLKAAASQGESRSGNEP